MILKHSEEFKSACLEAGVISTLVKDTKRDEILSSIFWKFEKRETYNYPLWDNLKSDVAVTFRFAWKWFEEILKDKKVVFFFEPDEQDEMIEIEDGGLLPQILDNAYRFTFYITDYDSSFLLCYNDHDNLVATGQATDWLTTYLKNNYPDQKIFISEQQI